jgi:hypothetical protein
MIAALHPARSARSAAWLAVWLLGLGWASAETMTVSTLFSAPINPLNAVHPLWTPVQHYRGMTFVVVPDVRLRPMVTQIDRAGVVTTVPLDPGADYLASSDGHNRFTMGIDQDGYLHIAGDMHGYAWWASTYIARYQYQNMLYWRSNRPLDVTGGFTFAGGADSATALPGEEWGGDSRFFNDRDGVLYFSSRVRAFTGGPLSGSEPFIAYGLYRYDVATGRWRALGGSAATAAPGATRYNTVLYWEHTTSFEAYQCAPRFDARNRLHFAIAGNTAGTEGQGLIYAVSDDGGETWRKADGSAIPGLPLRGKDGEPHQGDLVIRSKRVAQQSPLYIDRDGRVAVHGDGTWRTWSGEAWTAISGGMGILGPDGMMTLDGGSALVRAPALGQPAVAFDTGFGQVFSLSELGLQTDGSIYGVGLPPGTNFTNATTMSVFKATFSPWGTVATGGTASASSETAQAGQAFDGSHGSKWYTGSAAPGWLQYSFAAGTRHAVFRYDLTSANDAPERDPRDWRLEGSADGAAWTPLDARTGEQFSGRGQTRSFTVAAPAMYACYRLAIGANRGGTAHGLQLGELRLMAVDATSVPSTPRISWSQGDDARTWLSWTPAERAATYVVKRAPAKGGSFAVIGTGVVQTGDFLDSTCVNGTAYRYVVAGVNAAGQGPDSAPVTVTPHRHAARPPIIQTAIGRNGGVTLSWLPLWPEATSYTVKRATNKAGPYTTVATRVTGRGHTDRGLVEGTTYHYVVSASHALDGESPDSAPVSAAPFRWKRSLQYRSVGKDDAGTASASAENPPREGAAMAFDGGRNSKWLMPASSGWLQYRFAPGDARTVTRYRMISGGDAPDRDPTDWTFEGSSDGKTWVVLDTRKDQAFAERNAVNTYVFANRMAYQSYRLNITRCKGNGLTQLAELELWEEDAPVGSAAAAR